MVNTFKVQDLEAGQVPGVNTRNREYATQVSEYLTDNLKQGEACLLTEVVKELKIELPKEQRQSAYSTIKRTVANLNGFEVVTVSHKVIVKHLDAAKKSTKK